MSDPASILLQKKEALDRLESNYNQLLNYLSYYDSDSSLRILEENDQILKSLHSMDEQINSSIENKYPKIMSDIQNTLSECNRLHNLVTPLLYKTIEKHREELNTVSVQIQLKEHLRRAEYARS